MVCLRGHQSLVDGIAIESLLLRHKYNQLYIYLNNIKKGISLYVIYAVGDIPFSFVSLCHIKKRYVFVSLIKRLFLIYQIAEAVQKYVQEYHGQIQDLHLNHNH